jgi:hypothetical protein
MSMDEPSIRLSPRKLKSFVKHLCLATKLIEERDAAKKDLSEHFEAIKKLSSSKTGQKNLPKSLKELKVKIDDTIEKEKRAVKIQHHVPLHAEKLNQKIELLDSKLQEYAVQHEERKSRVAELEKKIVNDPKAQMIKELREQVSGLEQKYREMLKNHSAQSLEKFKSKIDVLKSKIKN